MPLFTKDSKLDVLVAETSAQRFEPSTGQIFKAALGEGFDLTTTSAGKRFADFKTTGDSPQVSVDQFKDSKHFRQGLEHFEGMTEEHAEILAKRHDTREKRNFVLSHTKGGLDTLTMLTGGLVGSIPDPVNFIPIVGIGAKVGAVARIGIVAKRLKALSDVRKLSIGGRALVSSIEAGGASLISQPLILKTEQLEQGDYDMRMAAMNIAFSTGIGAGFGVLTHAFRGLSVKDNMAATSKAMRDMADDIYSRHVDVEGVVGTKVNKVEIRDLVKRFIAGEDVRGEGIIHPKLRDADAFIRETRPGGITGDDIIQAIRKPAFVRTKLDDLIVDAVDDNLILRDVLRISTKSNPTKEEIVTLGAFRNNTEKDFNSSMIAIQKERIDTLKQTIKNNKGKLTKIEKKLDSIELSEQENAVVRELKKRGFSKEEISDFKKVQKGKKAVELFSKRQDKIDDINVLVDESKKIQDNIDSLNARNAVVKSGKAEVDFATTIKPEPVPEVEVKLDKNTVDMHSAETSKARLDETAVEFDSRLKAGELEGAEAAIKAVREENSIRIKQSKAIKLIADCVVEG